VASDWKTVRIAEGSAADAKHIAELSKRVIEYDLGWRWQPAKVMEAMRNPRMVVLVARFQTEFTGFGIMEYFEKRANLSLLAVEKEFHKKGIGRRLVHALQDVALKNDIENIYVQVRETNKEGIRFYEKLGYEMIDLTKRYYRGKENAVIMYNYLSVANHIN